MHIAMLFSTQLPPVEGVGRHVADLAVRLRDAGHRVTLLTRGGWRGTREEDYEGFRVIKAAFYPLYPLHVHLHRPAVQRALARLVPPPDLVHLHMPLVPPAGGKWPVVTTFHTPMRVDTAQIEITGVRSLLIKIMGKTSSYLIEREVLKTSDAIMTVSAGVARELRQYYGVAGEHVAPVLNVIDTALFQPSGSLPARPRVLFVGRLAYRKGLLDILASAVQVVRAIPEAEYVFIGSGPLAENLAKRAAGYGLTSQVRFLGEIRDREALRRHYQGARVVLVPSHYEGLPLVLLEAMACGKAVVSTTANFTRGILEHGRNALLVRPKSPEELARATIRLLSDHDLASALGAAARRTVCEKMAPEKHTHEVLRVYQYARSRFSRRAPGLAPQEQPLIESL